MGSTGRQWERISATVQHFGRMSSFLATIAAFLACLFVLMSNHKVTGSDSHVNCQAWAEEGECEKNPRYMLESCADACASQALSQDVPQSFYDIIETDINGNEVNFKIFEGKPVYVVNTASYCGYTAENFAALRQLKRLVTDGLQLVLAPCNQFGSQEPGSSADVAKFAKEQGYEGLILSKADVNGADTRPAFRFLKSKTSKHYIQWNFDGKFFIDAQGSVHSLAGSDPVAEIERLMSREL